MGFSESEAKKEALNTTSFYQSEEKEFTESKNALLSPQEFHQYSQIIRDSYE